MSWSDTTPAPNLAGTHSYLATVRRTDRIPLWHLLEVFMTLQKAKLIARHLGHKVPVGGHQRPALFAE